MRLRSGELAGVMGYGVAIPRLRLAPKEIASFRKLNVPPFPAKFAKSVPAMDEDATTLAIEAAENAIIRACVSPESIQALYVGTESKPYAVKPISGTVAEAVGIGPYHASADLEFACKAGTEAIRCSLAHVLSFSDGLALAIGSDTAQAAPGNELEWTSAAGAAAFLVGQSDDCLALIEATTAATSDTPDFFRRSGEKYPVHGGRFTGKPAYFSHTLDCAKQLLAITNFKPSDFAHAIFHQPNSRFPREVAQELGFKPDQIGAGMVADEIGNTYSACSLLGLASVLDSAKPHERILFVSYGSGAGADGFVFRTTNKIAERRHLVASVQDYLNRAEFIDYAYYLQITDAIRH